MVETIFSKIIRKEIPASIVYENEDVLAFKDINPVAPVHVLIIPKIIIPTINDIDDISHSELLSKLFAAVKEVAKKLNISETGYRVVINCGPDGGQEVYHLHLHLIGGKKLNWPPC